MRASVIARYTRPELGALWTDQAKMDAWRDVEVAAAEALDGPTEADLEAIRGATFTVEAVQEREAVTDHDVAAFVDVLAASAGRGRALDPLRADLLRRARHRAGAAAAPRGGAGRWPARARCAAALAEQAREHAGTLCVGPHARRARRADDASGSSSRASRWRRTATPSGWSARSRRSPRARSPAPSARTRRSARTSRRACSSGSGCAGEPVSTQVVPRDRHAELLSAIALAGAGLERFATEIRHLQRTEVREVEEPFRAGQKGSSAMPHKRNPITTERITGLARVLRGYAQTGLENVALWHERDISHSGAERVVLPDATILLDYMQHLALRVARGMTVHADRMRANLEITSGALFSQRVLLGARGVAGCSATTPTGSSSASPSRPGTRARRCASCSRRRTASSSTSTPSSTTPTTSATSRRCSQRLEVIPQLPDADRHLRRPRRRAPTSST